MNRVVKDYLSRLPEGALTNRLRCWRHNLFEENPFKMHYHHGCFLLEYQDFTLRFHENPFSDLAIDGPGYFLKRKIQPGDIIVDAGAYVGALTVFMAVQAGDAGQVIAFEPDPHSAEQLRANLRLNQLENVTVIEKGLWDCERNASWIDAGSHIARVSPDATEGTTEVSLTSLDAALAAFHLPKIDFIKMDIEGAELRALTGACTTLQTHHPDLAIASYHAYLDGVTAPHVEEQLRSLGYCVETGNLHHLTTWGWREAAE